MTVAAHLDRCCLRRALVDLIDCIWTFSPSDVNQGGAAVLSTVLSYERREVAFVFYALGDVDRTSGLCFFWSHFLS